VDRETFFRETGLDALRPLVALLPGSRREEIQRLLPPLVELVKAWREDPAHEGVQWVLPLAPTLARSFVETFIGDAPIVVVAGQSYAPRAYADAALVCSGTATLETALLGTPFAILYRMNPLTLALARRFVKVPFFGLANVVAGREVAPELLQGEVNPARLGQELSRLLQPERRDRIHRDLAEVRTHLGEPGAAGRVAEHLLSKLG
jgi:lipid-A-disaccharide synthase